MKRSSRISVKSQISLILAIAMILGGLSSLILQPVYAETVRSAQIEKVTGIVHIQKAGSAKPFRAYEGMILHYGDHIRTEENSSLVFQVTDRGDNITVGEKSQLYISDLRNESGKIKTSFYIWSGSMWVEVSTLANSEDEFEIETPAAFMSVRGTTLLVGVDPETGESKFFIASGQGKVNKKDENEPTNGTTLYPNQGIVLDEDTDADDYEEYTNIADLEDLIANTSSAIIEAIIASKAAMDKENQEYIAELQRQQGGTDGTNKEAIDRINQNLDNLVGNIVNNAIKQNKVNEAAIKAFIEQINRQLDKKLDLDNVKAQELSAQEKAKQAQIKKLEEERKKKQEAEKLKQEALKKQNEELQQKLKEQLEKQKLEKQKAAEAAKQKAAEEYAKKLTDDAAKLAFEAKQKAIAAEKARQDAAVKAAPAPAAPPSQTGSDSGTVNRSPVLTIVSPTVATFNNGFNQEIVVQTEAGATLQLYNGVTPVPFHTEISDDDVTKVTLIAYELAEGVYNFTVKATDAAGIGTTRTVHTITIDRKAPELTLQSPITEISNNTGSLDIVIQTEENTTVTVSTLGSDAILATGLGRGLGSDVVLNVAGLDEDEYIFTVRATDAAGNETILTVPTIHIDKSPPTIEEFDVDRESPVTRHAEIRITVEKGALIQILHENVPVASGIGDGDNMVTITLPLLDIGDYWFIIKATDAAGNVTTRTVEYSLNVYYSEP